MNVFPSSAEERLGFDVLRAWLRSRVRSRLGQDRVDAMRPSHSIAWVRRELGRVSELQQAYRFDDPVPLDHVLDVRDVLRRAAPEEAFVGPEDLLAVRLTAVTLRRLKAYFEARSDKYPALAGLVRRITPLPDLEQQISEAVDEEGRVRDTASPELGRLRRLIVRRQEQLRATLLAELRKAMRQGYATEEQPTIRNGRMVIPVRAEAKRKVQGFVQDTSASGQTVYIEPAACLDLNNEVRELETEERREVERILRMLTAQLRRHLGDLRENVRVLAAFDLLQAKAHLANKTGAVVPELNEDGVVEILGGRNPVLFLHFEHLREQEDGDAREVVPLDLKLGDSYRTLVITGPNAGGKTVAMKTVGLFALMLAYGLPLPVKETSRMALFHKLFVDIGDEQSIEEDLSTFSSHVSNLKRMLREADANTLVLIDEAGTGTDPEEGGALAQAVLERLTDVGARTIATTHHGTLKVFAYETEGVENGSMEFDQRTLSPTYRFRAGIPGSSYAFEIAERIGLEHAILERARALVGRQKTALEEVIATFETRNQALQERLATLEETRRKTERDRLEYEQRLGKIEKEREAIRQQALEEAERIVREANARVEQTIRRIRESQAEKEATRRAREELEQFKETLGRRRAVAEQRRERRKQRQEGGQTATAEERQPERVSDGRVQVGDQVVLDQGTTAAEVLEIEDDEAVVAIGSVRMRVALERLTKVGGPRKQQVVVRHVPAGDSGGAATTARTQVDLRGYRVDEALQEVTKLIDEAVAAGLNKVEILHGKGTGALRQAIHEQLLDAPEVEHFEDAPWNQGGAGVTIVNLR